MHCELCNWLTNPSLVSMENNDFDRRMRYLGWLEENYTLKLRFYQKVMLFLMINETMLQIWETTFRALPEPKS